MSVCGCVGTDTFYHMTADPLFKTFPTFSLFKVPSHLNPQLVMNDLGGGQMVPLLAVGDQEIWMDVDFTFTLSPVSQDLLVAPAGRRTQQFGGEL